MAAVDGVIERVATDHVSQRCSELNTKGFPCRAWALRGQDVCHWHSMTPEEQRAFQARSGQKRQQDRREDAGLRDSSRHRHAMPGPTLARVIEVVAELLDAEIPDGTHEPDMIARGVGVLAAAALFGIRPDQKTETLELLAKIRPNLATDPQVARLLRLEEARQTLLRYVEEGRLDVSELPFPVARLGEANAGVA